MVASTTSSPAVGQTMDLDIHPIRSNQPSSLPHPQVIWLSGRSKQFCTSYRVLILWYVHQGVGGYTLYYSFGWRRFVHLHLFSKDFSSISHLFFVHDILILCRGSRRNIRAILYAFAIYGDLSGQRINYQKNHIYIERASMLEDPKILSSSWIFKGVL